MPSPIDTTSHTYLYEANPRWFGATSTGMSIFYNDEKETKISLGHVFGTWSKTIVKSGTFNYYLRGQGGSQASVQTNMTLKLYKDGNLIKSDSCFCLVLELKL